MKICEFIQQLRLTPSKVFEQEIGKPLNLNREKSMADLGKANGAITIEVGVSISNETIELCLSIIEYWLNQNPNKRIVGGIRGEDGRVHPLRIDYQDMGG